MYMPNGNENRRWNRDTGVACGLLPPTQIAELVQGRGCVQCGRQAVTSIAHELLCDDRWCRRELLAVIGSRKFAERLRKRSHGNGKNVVTERPKRCPALSVIAIQPAAVARDPAASPDRATAGGFASCQSNAQSARLADCQPKRMVCENDVRSYPL